MLYDAFGFKLKDRMLKEYEYIELDACVWITTYEIYNLTGATKKLTEFYNTTFKSREEINNYLKEHFEKEVITLLI